MLLFHISCSISWPRIKRKCCSFECIWVLQRNHINIIFPLKHWAAHRRTSWSPALLNNGEWRGSECRLMLAFKSLKRPQWRCRMSCLCFCTAAHKLNVMLSPATLPIPGKFSFHCMYIAFWCLMWSRPFHGRSFRSKESVCNKEAFSKFPLKFLLQRILSSSFRLFTIDDTVTTTSLVLSFEITLLFPLNTLNHYFHFWYVNSMLMKKTRFPSAVHREGIRWQRQNSELAD